ncbi:MAG: glycogen debranching enzyme, partial [Anaerolineae bacterium]|nr:glycogen debranching enzyme [Anaerolineae bacterium]
MIAPGKSFPLGATVSPGGVNFSVYSKNGAAAELLLFDRAHDPQPSRVIALGPAQNRTFHFWHAFVPELGPG